MKHRDLVSNFLLNLFILFSQALVPPSLHANSPHDADLLMLTPYFDRNASSEAPGDFEDSVVADTVLEGDLSLGSYASGTWDDPKASLSASPFCHPPKVAHAGDGAQTEEPLVDFMRTSTSSTVGTEERTHTPSLTDEDAVKLAYKDINKLLKTSGAKQVRDLSSMDRGLFLHTDMITDDILASLLSILKGVESNGSVFPFVKVDCIKVTAHGYKSLATFVENYRHKLNLHLVIRNRSGKYIPYLANIIKCMKGEDIQIDNLLLGHLKLLAEALEFSSLTSLSVSFDSFGPASLFMKTLPHNVRLKKLTVRCEQNLRMGNGNFAPVKFHTLLSYPLLQRYKSEIDPDHFCLALAASARIIRYALLFKQNNMETETIFPFNLPIDTLQRIGLMESNLYKAEDQSANFTKLTTGLMQYARDDRAMLEVKNFLAGSSDSVPYILKLIMFKGKTRTHCAEIHGGTARLLSSVTPLRLPGRHTAYHLTYPAFIDSDPFLKRVNSFPDLHVLNYYTTPSGDGDTVLRNLTYGTLSLAQLDNLRTCNAWDNDLKCKILTGMKPIAAQHINGQPEFVGVVPLYPATWGIKPHLLGRIGETDLSEKWYPVLPCAHISPDESQVVTCKGENMSISIVDAFLANWIYNLRYEDNGKRVFEIEVPPAATVIWSAPPRGFYGPW